MTSRRSECFRLSVCVRFALPALVGLAGTMLAPPAAFAQPIVNSGFCDDHATDPGGKCDDGIPCTIDTCDEVLNVCRHAPDDSACKEGEGCVGGVCVTEDDNECTENFCDPIVGCIFPADNANPCADGSPCTGDVCIDGLCVPIVVNCSDSGNDCTADVCNATTGVCEEQPINEGLECSDHGDHHDDDECTNSVCVAGVCQRTPDDTKTCSDHDPCTDDACVAGLCVSAPVDCSFLDDQCNVGVCNTAGTCVKQPAYETLPCDDGLFCSVGEVCVAGACNNATSRDCGDGVGCTFDTCDETANACLNTPDDTACPSDGNQCTLNLCDALLGCVAPPVPDGNACGIGTDTDCDNPDSCLGGVCVTNEEPAGTMCPDDGNECTFDQCDGAGNCTHPPVADNTACLSDGNECTDDVCMAGVCQHTPDDMNLCSDGDPCTNDACAAGICTGAAIDCSALDDQCNTGVCNAAGVCVKQPANETLPCDDGLFCSVSEVCVAGACTNATSRDCGDGVGCTTDTCNETTDMCIHTPVNSVCDNGLFCDGQEFCDPSLDCQSVADPCVAPLVCDEPNNRCVSCLTSAQCDDGEFCNGTETCDIPAGVCNAGTDPCPADAVACTIDSCDETADACLHTPDDAACPSDGNQCTLNVCDALLGCVAPPVPDGNACGIGTDTDCDNPDSCLGGVCVTNEEPPGTMCPDDGNECTFDQCDGAGNCTHPPVADNTACLSDGNECTDDVCMAGVCQHTPDDLNLCSDGDPCTNDACVAGICTGAAIDCSALTDQCNTGVCNAAGVCVKQPANETLPCDDGLFCSVGEVCVAGVCNNATSRDCGDGVGCTFDTCDETTDVCVHTPDDTACPSDGNQCTLNVCDALLGCVAPPVPDGNACGTSTDTDCDNPDSCLAGVCATNEEPPGTPCPDDGIECTMDLCDGAGNCTHPPVADNTACLSDGNDCTDDVCLAGACQHPSNDLNACTDGLLCTTDACVSGLCVGTQIDCSTLDGDCTVGVCNAMSGMCEVQPANENGVCTDDGNACTDEMCVAGVCVHPPDDTNTCSDGANCTTDVCAAGTCVPTPIDCSSLNGECTDGVCNESTGTCEALPINETGPCTDDGNDCTDDVCAVGVCDHPIDNTNNCSDMDNCTNDVCFAGVCVGTAIDCSALDAECAQGVCNAATGSCQAQPINQNQPCTDDGLFCTGEETCTNGTCTSGGDPCGAGLMCDDAGDKCVECFTGADCADADDCTLDICSPAGTCAHANVCGACCVISNGTCLGGVTPGDCVANGGGFLGAGTSCLGDADGDGRDDACPITVDIPTMSQWGVAVLTLLLLVVGKIYFGRRSTPIRVERR